MQLATNSPAFYPQPMESHTSITSSSNQAIQDSGRVRLKKECLVLKSNQISSDPIGHGKGKVLETLKTSFTNDIAALKKYTIFINAEKISIKGKGKSTALQQKLENHEIRFVNERWIKNSTGSSVLRFNLPEGRENHQVVLAHKNGVNMNTESEYRFEMKAGYKSGNAVFFQLKETGGNIHAPSIQLRIVNNNTIRIQMNSQNGKVLEENIAELECPNKWFTFRVKTVWHRQHPLVQITINGKNVFQSTEPFGALDSKKHYSKFGIFAPLEEKEFDVGPKMLFFKSFKETHRHFVEPENLSTTPKSVEKCTEAHTLADIRARRCKPDIDPGFVLGAFDNDGYGSVVPY